MERRLLNIILLLLISINGMSAKTLKEARALYSKGEYAKAKPLFEKEYKRKPKDASINHWLGVCYYKTGNANSAIKYLKYADSKDIIESSHFLAKIYIESYDFKAGLEMYERYRNILAESDKSMPDNAENEYNKAKIAKSMLEHVEKIVVIDSILVDKNKFFSYYSISPESGTISLIPQSSSSNMKAISHCNQNGDRKLWSMKDKDGKLRICESTKLIDGTWEPPHFLKGELNNGGDAEYPYLMQDGTTLYYACNGEGSIGGYDIFMTRKDTETGEYLRPQNVGMPYNSYYDDYLLVLDDISGMGWWATDRNKVDGKLTIYVFIRNSIRENYDIDEDNIVSFAKLSNYRATWGKEDYSSLVRKIRTLETNSFHSPEDFIFYVRKGVIYTSFSDFKSSDASEQMSVLLDMYVNLEELRILLRQKRATYVENKSDELKDEIIDLEKKIEQQRKDIFKIENKIRYIEQNIN